MNSLPKNIVPLEKPFLYVCVSVAQQQLGSWAGFRKCMQLCNIFFYERICLRMSTFSQLTSTGGITMITEKLTSYIFGVGLRD